MMYPFHKILCLGLTVFYLFGCNGDIQTSKSISHEGQPQIAPKTNTENTKLSGGIATKVKLFEATELITKSPDELRLIRNEIFARHGYIFTSTDLQKHFSSKSWYVPRHENVDTKLSEIEQLNVRLVKDTENLLSGTLPKRELFRYYASLFKPLADNFSVMTENPSRFNAFRIPTYFDSFFGEKHGTQFGRQPMISAVGMGYKNEQIVTLLTVLEDPSPASFSVTLYMLTTYLWSGEEVDRFLFAEDNFDGYVSARVSGREIETIGHQLIHGEEEGPNGLPEVQGASISVKERYIIQEDGKFKLIKTNPSDAGRLSMTKSELFDEYSALFEERKPTFTLDGEVKVISGGKRIPQYFDGHFAENETALCKIKKEGNVILLVTGQVDQNAMNWAPISAMLRTYTIEGQEIDQIRILHNDFDGYQSASFEEDSLVIKTYVYQRDENEEEPDGSGTIVATNFKSSQTFTIDKSGQILEK